MILLNNAVCSKDFRKVGLVSSYINIVLQVALVVTSIILHYKSNDRNWWYDSSLFSSDWFHSQSLRNLLVDAIFFCVLDVILYLLLIYGLAKRKTAAITVWLTFSVAEFVIVEAAVFTIGFFLTINWNAGLGILGMIIAIATAVYLFYHMCVVYSARQDIIKQKGSTNTNTAPPTTVYAHYNANAATINSPTMQPVQLNMGIPQYTITPQNIVIPATSSSVQHINPPTMIADYKGQPPAYST